MKPLRPTASDFVVHKDYKIDLKFVSPVSGISFRTHYLTCPLINHRFIIYHNIFLKSLPCESPHSIFHQPLIIDMLIMLMACCFRSSSRHAMQVSELKIISLYLVMVSLMASSTSSFVFLQFRWGIFNFFASSHKDVLFIYYY